MVKSDNTTIKALADLNGKKVCTARNSTTPTNLTDKNVTANLTLLEGYPECAAALAAGSRTTPSSPTAASCSAWSIRATERSRSSTST